MSPIQTELHGLSENLTTTNILLVVLILVLASIFLLSHYWPRHNGKGALTKAGKHLKDYHGGGDAQDVIDACEELAEAHDFSLKRDKDGEFEGADTITDVLRWLWDDRDSFVEEVVKAASQAWSGSEPGYSQSPIELITRIIDERDELKQDALRYRRLRQVWIACEELNLNGKGSVVDDRLDGLLRTEMR